MKKFFLLGCVVLGSSISAMEKVISEPMSDLTLTDEVIRAVAAQAVAHYDAVVKELFADSHRSLSKAVR